MNQATVIFACFLMYTDIDECVSGVHDCHSSASCTNTAGSYTCSCNNPYTGDGKACKMAAGEYPTLIIFCSKCNLMLSIHEIKTTQRQIQWK